MKHRILPALLVTALAPFAQDTATTPAPSHPFQTATQTTAHGWWNALGSDTVSTDSLQKISMNLGVMPGSDANGKRPERILNAFSLAVVSTEAGAVKGVQLAGGMTDVHGSVSGVQGTFGLNLVGGSLSGVQGGGVNLVHGNVTGFQYGALFSKVGGNLDGVQVGNLGNTTQGELRGVQAASIVNHTHSLIGVQNGMLNFTDRARGLQLGMINSSSNIAGVQFGLVNVADTMNGPQIGLVNIRPDSRVFVEAWTDEVGLSHVGLNYGSPGWYNILDIGVHNEGDRGAIGLGFGARMPSNKLILSTDLSGLMVFNVDQLDSYDKQHPHHRSNDTLDADAADAFNSVLRLRATVGYHLWKRLAVFGGVSYNLLFVPSEGHGTHQLRPYGSYHWDAQSDLRTWPGAFVGVRF